MHKDSILRKHKMKLFQCYHSNSFIIQHLVLFEQSNLVIFVFAVHIKVSNHGFLYSGLPCLNIPCRGPDCPFLMNEKPYDVLLFPSL